MYRNIGRKIKTLAGIIGYVGIVLNIAIGILLTIYLYNNYLTEDFAFVGIIVGVIGVITCWIAQFVIYGFGELIDQTMQINKKINVSNNEANSLEKIAKLKEWREKGLIEESEYVEKLSSFTGAKL